jgi:hypothetical protein
MSDLNTCLIPAATLKSLIQLLNVSDFHSETHNLGSKHFYIIHMIDTFRGFRDLSTVEVAVQPAFVGKVSQPVEQSLHRFSGLPTVDPPLVYYPGSVLGPKKLARPTREQGQSTGT